MHEISVETEFCAAHALVIAGRREQTHGHNFRVRVTVGAPDLDADGLVCDFHGLEAVVRGLIEPWRDRDLNQAPPFDRINPSAERIAEQVALGVGSASLELGPGVRVLSVSVTEAPGCVATHRPEPKL
jgi:6-pyruvoyltetrahydropterin/6-carboxytetrahydropterin synthase